MDLLLCYADRSRSWIYLLVMLRLGFASTHQAILSAFVSLSSHCCNVTPPNYSCTLIAGEAAGDRQPKPFVLRRPEPFSSSFEFRSQRVSRWSDAKKKKKKSRGDTRGTPLRRLDRWDNARHFGTRQRNSPGTVSARPLCLSRMPQMARREHQF
jgi:hypothetical protein